MALVRVYCGLASADSAGRPVSTSSTLTAAVVDDAGRLLNVCEIGDDPTGYAQLGTVLVERSGGPSGAAIAADSDDHKVIELLSAAGRPLALADDDSVDDFAERFADDESMDEMEAPPAQRRAVGLARALQAGALSATTLPAPRDLAGYKPVLAAHAALATGRHGAAVALREVLRELYPAALRAYPDPAESISLAVLDALPEPSMLGGTSARGRDTAVATDEIAAHLAAEGVAEPGAITEAITALRVAIAETPRRAPVNKAITSAIAETIRQAVAAVRACDAACDALVSTLGARATTPLTNSNRRTVRRAAPDIEEAAAAPAVIAARPGIVARPQPAPEPVPSGGRRSRPEPAPGSGMPLTPRPVAPPPVAPAPVAPAPVAPPPVAPPPMAPRPMMPAASLPSPVPASPAPTSAPPATYRREQPANRPVSGPPPPPPGITPITHPTRGSVPPADAGEPFRATLTTAAINSARSERQRPTPITPRPKTNGESRLPSGGFGATDLSLPMPAPRPVTEPSAPPGSRANWPLVGSTDSRPGGPDSTQERPFPFGGRADQAENGRGAERGASEGRVTPPWLADDLPPEPPSLRLVEPPEVEGRGLDERGLRDRAIADRHLGERVVDDRNGIDRGFGDRSLAERGFGERGDFGDRPDGDRPDGDRPNGDRPNGEYRPNGGYSNGDLGLGNRPHGERPLGDRPMGEQPFGDRPFGERPFGDRPGSDRGAGDQTAGPRRFNDRGLGDLAPLDRSGDRLLEGNGPLAPIGNGLPHRDEPRLDGTPLRLVEPDVPQRATRVGRSRRSAESDPPSAPVSQDGDGDLLIFSATRSAWFTGHAEESELDWSSTAADTGWRAAEQAAQPAVGAETGAGLPKRVPQANLVPGSPLRDERPLRIVRDAARIAEHTTGYFRGWRRGQEIGGYAVGGRPGREAAGGWDFSRDPVDRDDEFRPASYRS